MKNLALIILALITLNCENEEVCTCEKETYRVNTVQLENGNLVSEFPVNIIFDERLNIKTRRLNLIVRYLHEFLTSKSLSGNIDGLETSSF